MRILHISTRLILGGSQENTVLSCEAQAHRGHEVHLAFGPIEGPEGSLLARVERFRADSGAAITTHVVPHLVREVRPASDIACLGELKELVVKLKPDVVHTHSSKAGILGRLAAWRVAKNSCGIVHTIHGPPFMPSEGGVVRRAKIAAVNYAYTLAERLAARRCHVIVSVAGAMTEQFLARGIGRPGQYATVYSGMETRAFLEPAPGESRGEVREQLGLREGGFVIGTLARLAPHKGHDDLLTALQGELASRPSWRLLWAGDGALRERLTSRARAMGLRIAELDRGQPAGDAQVLLAGLIEPSRVPAVLRAIDVLAHPSLREGLPRAVVQGLLCGVPPVVYSVDGGPELCGQEGERGLLVAAGDTAGLRAAVTRLHDDADLRRQIGRRGQAWCAQRFDVAVMAQRLEEEYARARSMTGMTGMTGVTDTAGR